MNFKHDTFFSHLSHTRFWLSLILFLAGLLSYSASAAQVVATVSSNQVGVNEIFELKVSIDDNVSQKALDLSPLAQDFTVGTPSTRSFNSFVNGTVSRRTEWRVALAANKTGQFTIPAFRIGASRSEPIVIQVSDQPSQKSLNTDLAIEISGRLDKSKLYVGESQIYQVQLKVGEQLEQASLIAPQGDGIEVVQVGDDHQAETVLNGRRYMIVNRKYRITAKQPGDITLQGAKLTGTAFKSGRGRTLGLRIPVHLQADPEPLTVLAKPAHYQGLWLPTPDLQLNQQWQNDAPVLKVGEPITRVLTLKMKGTPQSQMPDLSLSYPDSVRVYSEKPVYTQQDNYSVMTLKQVIIPRETGTITLPPLKVNWWNTETGQQAHSLATGKILEVKPDNTTPGTASSTSSTNTASTNGQSNGAQHSTPSVPGGSTQQDVSPWWPWLTLLMTILWLATLLLWLKARQSKQHQPGNTGVVASSEPVKKRLVSAVRARQPLQIQTLYQQWDKSQLDPAQRTALDQAIQTMMAAFYGKSPEAWDNQPLLHLLQRDSSPAKQTEQQQTLAPIVPDLPSTNEKNM
ncbi:BatD family protein [Photobacterium sp. 1_MG-2023]|uniref:BatD family protein n=1 Tax=Photobacterium sp. 1_MG-2023 TaxID=3062646 RepID=UPI0026E22ED4|nr:BatD family protein [Photobacterium sp. 1_MG-2023]MDO6705857.1 BatD family protein [Photobacterium sp. 1_MG-2023]